MASVKRVLTAAGAAAIAPFVAAGAIGVPRHDARRERQAPRHRRGGRCPDARTVARSGRGDRRRHTDDPPDGPAVVHRVGRSLRASVGRTRRRRPVLRHRRVAGRPHAATPGTHGGARRSDRSPRAAGSRSSRSTAAGTPSTANPAASGGDRSPPTASCRCDSCGIRAVRARGSSPCTARAWGGCATTACSVSGDSTRNSASTWRCPSSRCTDRGRRASLPTACSCRTCIRSTTCSG